MEEPESSELQRQVTKVPSSIQISGHYGDPKADAIYWPFQRNLNGALEPLDCSDYLVGIERLSIVLRVSGRVTDFKGCGPERLKFLKRDKEITIDLVIPESDWRGAPDDEIRRRLFVGLNSSFEYLLERAKALGALKDEGGLRTAFRLGVAASGLDLCFAPPES